MADTFAQGRVKWFMRHTYVWRQTMERFEPPGGKTRMLPVSVNLSNGAADAADVQEAWGVQDPSYGPPIPGKPCIFHDGGEELDDATGELVRIHPTLRVPWDDPIDEDDLVDAVYDSNGLPLAVGTMRVMTITKRAPHGPTLYREIPLRSTQVEG